MLRRNIPRHCKFCAQIFYRNASVHLPTNSTLTYCSRQCSIRDRLQKRVAERVGKRFFALVVLGYEANGKWLFRCDCGRVYRASFSKVRTGHAKSCGCGAQDPLPPRASMSEYTSWQSMKERCLKPSHKSYARYGGRGITICERWLNSFGNFYADMGPKPTPQYSLERKDNNKNYEPDNCMWALPIVQSRNNSLNRNITFNGETLCLAAWAERIGIRPASLSHRLNAGWPLDAALTWRKTARWHSPIATRR